MDDNQYKALKEILEMFGVKNPKHEECVMLKKAIDEWRATNSVKTDLEAVVHASLRITDCITTIEDCVFAIKLTRMGIL